MLMLYNVWFGFSVVFLLKILFLGAKSQRGENIITAALEGRIEKSPVGFCLFQNSEAGQSQGSSFGDLRELVACGWQMRRQSGAHKSQLLGKMLGE